MLKNKRIWITLIMFFVAFAVLTSATLAWQAINNQVNSDGHGMKIQPVTDLTTIQCWALKYDGVYGAICYEITEDSYDVTMTEYDNIFRDRNVNTPLIYVLEIGNVPDNEGDFLTVQIPCTQYYIESSNSGSFSSESAVNSYISNVISVKVGCSGKITAPTPTTTLSVENNVNLFNTQVSAFSSITSGDQCGEFVNVTTASGDATTYVSYEKNSTIEVKLSRDDYTDDLYEGTTDGVTSNHLILYIEFDYSDELITAFDNFSTDDDFGQTIFANDLGTIQIVTGHAD